MCGNTPQKCDNKCLNFWSVEIQKKSFIPNLCRQSSYRSTANDSNGAIYTHRPLGYSSNILIMANSAHNVFPLPDGAPINILSSFLKNVP